MNVDGAGAKIWNSSYAPSDNDSSQTTVVLEQYRIYVESMNQSMDRRTLVNTFFLTLNTTIITLIGASISSAPDAHEWALIFPLIR